MKSHKIFSFFVKHFWFLKAVPIAPRLFDSLLRLWLLFTDFKLLQWIDEIESEILNWEGVNVRMHKFGGLQFDYKKAEIGHLHSNGLMDISFSRVMKQKLIDEGRVSSHHVFNNTGWISFTLRSKDDVNYAIRLMKVSYDHKRNKE